jgi:hypothetical protein
LFDLYDVGEFAFDPRRASDFRDDRRFHGRQPGRQHAGALVQASLRAAFRKRLSPYTPNADINARLAAAVLSCFPSDLFDSTGLMRSLWLAHLTTAADGAQALIDELLGIDCPAALPKAQRRGPTTPG